MRNLAGARISTVLVFATVLLTGCTHRTKSKPESESRALQDATAALSRVARAPNAIPDAVLNATKCVVVVPSVLEKTDVKAAGTASCRESPQPWSAPWPVTFAGRTGRLQGSDLLIFILSDAGKRALRSAKLQIMPSPAPLVSTTPIPTQVDLSRESLTYQAGEGILSRSQATGFVSRGAMPAGTMTGLGHAERLDAAYQSALESLFNSIVPTGIVIHHTAVLPAQGRPPRSTSEVDRYHQSRGFEITCEDHVYHVAYHYLIFPDGRVQPGRPERCEGAHAEGYNSYLGISVVGDFSARDNPIGKKGLLRPTEQQIASLIRLCRELQARYRIPLQHIVRHSDISSTRCPGDRFPFAVILRDLASQPIPVKSGHQ
jgi:hypothetical protein